jgi:hypothetical protein
MTPRPGDTPGPKRSEESFILPPPIPTEPNPQEPRSADDRRVAPFVPPRTPASSNWAWFLFQVMMFSLLFGLIGTLFWYVLGQFEQPQPINTGKGRLVVVVVLDHFRGDFPDRWAKLCDANGFEKVRSEGVWFSDAHWPYAITDSAPGYASLSTGAAPAGHGIIAKDWLDRGSRQVVQAGQANQLLVPTIGDSLRAASPKSRVVSLALNADAAELLGGQTSLKVAYDRKTGLFQSLQSERPAWLDQFNSSGANTRWQGRDWLSVNVGTIAEQFAGEDDAAGEQPLFPRGNTSFPHALGQDADYFLRLPATPFGHELLWELAKKTIEEENLGSDQVDLLWLGFNATRAIGEAFGPDSQEMLDATVRLDRLLTTLHDYLRQRHGSRHFTLIITSSNGLAPLPERAQGQQPQAERFNILQEYGELEQALTTAFGPAEEGKSTWLARPIVESFPTLEWNANRLKTCGVPRTEVFRFAKNWLLNRTATGQVLDQTQLATETVSDRLLRQVQLSYHPDRSADWLIIPQPYTSGRAAGTSAGSPNSYDTHITLMAAGPGIPKLGKVSDRTDGLIVTQLIAKALGISAPKNATAKLPTGF